MFLLIFLSLIPFCKVLIITLLYKCMAAFLEPIADKRIAGAMSGASTWRRDVDACDHYDRIYGFYYRGDDVCNDIFCGLGGMR